MLSLQNLSVWKDLYFIWIMKRECIFCVGISWVILSIYFESQGSAKVLN